jgi:tetratricopeptide (TPR) repeat protein
MTVEEAGTTGRYKAFISYSHCDTTVAVRLHRRLENYRLPPRLVGTPTPRGPVPARLTPIFRDIDELPAADDLSTEIKAALADSTALIVLCSPDAKASRWVNREIELFREIHPDRPILPALVRGDLDNAFPPALFTPGPDGSAREPIASDLRGEQERLGRIKLIAGLTGIGVDDLVQRDAQRRLRRVMAVTASAVIAIIVLSGLLVAAVRARAEAERQQAEAEGLIEFMLTDLRGRLKGVGRLDVMNAVNARAMDYYSDQSLAALPDQSLERRARILHAMGEDDEARGDKAAALAKFSEAHRTTSAIAARRPRDAESLFAHAQSEYWLGYMAYRKKDFRNARTHFQGYVKLADRMTELRPDNVRYIREQGYAQGNLCALALTPDAKDVTLADTACAGSVAAKAQVVKLSPKDGSALADLANAYGWLGDAQTASGARQKARRAYLAAANTVNRAVELDPQNLDYRDVWVTRQFSLAELEREEGQLDAAVRRLQAARQTVSDMVGRDPANQLWRERLAQIERKLASLSKVQKEKA